MTSLERLRQAAELLPAGAAITLPREALLEALGELAGPALLTVAGVAAQLHRSPSTVRGWCEAERFPGAFKLGGKDWRIPVAAVDGFLAAQRSLSSPQNAPGPAIAGPADAGVRRRRAPGAATDLADWRRHRG